MVLSQQKFRELVFEALYSFDFHQGDRAELCEFLMREHKMTKKNVQLALDKALSIYEAKEKIDLMIQSVSHSYDLNRIHVVERTILRLGLYELFISKENPCEIVIAEAKRLARKFTNEEAQAFVHALIDALMKRE